MMKTNKSLEIKKVNSENSPINIHDDNLMVQLGIRVPKLKERDSNVWTKTLSEKRMQRNAKHRVINVDGHFHTIPKTKIPVKSNLIIYLKKNNKYNKTTYSTECWQHEIPEIINSYRTEAGNVVNKYYWNGKTYKTNEYPFWK